MKSLLAKRRHEKLNPFFWSFQSTEVGIVTGRNLMYS